MPFPRNLLHDNEEIVLDLRPHWWVLISPLFVIGMVILGLAGAAFFVDDSFRDYVLIALLAAIIFAAFTLITSYLRWTTTNFVVTTDRLIYRYGIFAKQGIEIPLERVTNIAFHQTIFERILQSGDLLIESAGEGGQQPFSNIRHPQEVQNEIYRQMELSGARDRAEMGGGRREASIPEQINQLDELRQRGVISQAEFDAKKQQLLDRM